LRVNSGKLSDDNQKLSDMNSNYASGKASITKSKARFKQKHHVSHYKAKPNLTTSMRKIEEVQGVSLWIFKKNNSFRRKLSSIVLNPMFDNIILAFIIISTLLLASETPFDDPNGQKIYYLNLVDTCITSVFILEMVLKIIVFGFVINGKYSYIR